MNTLIDELKETIKRLENSEKLDDLIHESNSIGKQIVNPTQFITRFFLARTLMLIIIITCLLILTQ